MNDKMQDAINKQIQAETYSAYLYLSMASFFHEKGLDGMAQWMKSQAVEEMGHAMRMFDHVVERGGRVKLMAIDQPPLKWSGQVAVWENVAKHEAHVTSLIHKLVKLARKEEDYASENMLQWFVNEQVEEEANAASILQRAKMVGDAGQGLFMLDKELGARAVTLPVLLSE